MSNQSKFMCPKCDGDFANKSNLIRHLITCSGTNKDNLQLSIINESNSGKSIDTLFEKNDCIQCNFCYKTFDKQFYLDRHLLATSGYCYKIRTGKASTMIINNNNQTYNYNHQQNIAIQPIFNSNHITIAKHGEETISHITKEIMLELLAMESFTKMSTELTRLLYFNDEVPENKNWTIVYPRNKKAALELNNDTNKFERMLTEKVINYKFCNMIGLFLPMIEVIDKEDQETNNLTWLQRSNLKKLTSYFGITNISQEAKYIYDSIKEMAYNERLKTMKTWKENGHEGNHLSLKF